MLDIVKQLFENNVISEDIKSEIESAWQGRVQENREQITEEVREQVTATLREEFAQKYEHDKSIMAEAVESMIADRLHAELKEFAEDRQGLIEARASYARKMKQDASVMENFVLQQLRNEVAELHEDRQHVSGNISKLESFLIKSLSREIAELHEDRQAVAGNVNKLESFLVNSLATEIAEFYEDKQDLAETKVRLISESKQKFESMKKQFIAKSARIVESTVTRSLKREMVQLKEDIEASRKNDFGRRLFESFASEYAASYLNEKSEAAKLQNLLRQKDLELNEAAKIVAETQKIVESKETQLRVAKDIAERKSIMGELLGPLSGEKRTVMQELLESVNTDRLYVAYDKYLPSVLENNVSRKKESLIESKNSKEITGNKTATQSNSMQSHTTEIDDIRRLAGFKV